MKAKKLMAMGLAVTLCVSATACGKNKEMTQVSKVSVEVENPQMGELTSDTTYIGTVEPQQQVYVMPKLSGTVTQVNYKVGDTVKEGDVLFKIDDEAYQVQIRHRQELRRRPAEPEISRIIRLRSRSVSFRKI